MTNVLEKDYKDVIKNDVIKNDATNSLILKKPIVPLGESISRICSSFYCVNKNSTIEALSMDLDKMESVHTIGVVDDDFNIEGIVIRRELFDKLGKNFGRDIYKRKTVYEVAKEARIFNSNKNIFGIAEELKNELYRSNITYYVLEDDQKKFHGIFSTKDLLMYLSEITQNDINLAKNLQMNIVKDEDYIENANFSAIGASRMAKGVGGDFYTIKKIGERKWIMAICDVCGKGISASLISAIVGGMFEAYDFSKGLKDFIICLNKYIYNTFKLEKYLTGLFITFNEETGKINIFDMGHCMGKSNLFLARDNKYGILETKNYNLAIGLVEDVTVKKDSFTLNKNDLLALITDGVTDQRNARDEEYGVRNFVRVLKKNSQNDLRKIKKTFFEDIRIFKGTSHQQDDITFILLRKN